jgi:endonuclease/exonuclease/phosphatase family metal-dependent hydrolase
MGEHLTRLGADVLALQETFSSRVHRMLHGLGDYPHRAHGPEKGWLRTSSGLSLLSKHPIEQTRKMRFTRASGSDRFALKGILWSRLEVPGLGALDLFNTHLNAGNSPEKEAIRLYQLEEAARFISQIEHEHGRKPALWVGDFNTRPGDPAYRVITEALGWQSLVELPTYCPTLNTHLRKATPGQSSTQLDYIFAHGSTRGQLEVRRGSHGLVEPVRGHSLSDHLGLWVELQFKPSARLPVPAESTAVASSNEA